MARQRMVTRTVKVQVFNCLCMNTVLCEPFNKEVRTGQVFKTDKKRDDYLRKVIDTVTEKFVSVVDTQVNDVLYGMPEDKFIAGADILPARVIKDSEFAGCMNAPETEETA